MFTAMKRAILFFVTCINRSLTDLHFYIDVLNMKFIYSFRVLFFFYLLLGAILTGIFTIKTLPQWRNISAETIQKLAESYPTDASLTWNGIELSSRNDQLITLPVPEVVKNENVELDSAVIINTTTSDAPDNLSSYVYINNSEIYVNTTQGRWTHQPLHQLLGDDPYIFNKGFIMDRLPAFQQMVQDTLSTFPLVAMAFFSIGLFVGRLVLLLFDSIILQFAFQLMGKPLQYLKVYQIALHLLIPVEIINQLTLQLYPDTTFPMFTLSFWVLSIILLWHLRNLHVLAIDLKEK